ncbi:MAG: hypothetical protein VCB82_04395 [Alphaproteobacteria bacterium]
MKIKSKFILITIVVISLTGCIGALVPVIDLTNVDPQALQDSQSIQTYTKGQTPPLGYREIGPVKAWSCKNLTWDPPATKENALKQLKIMAHRLGATAIMGIEFGEHGTTGKPSVNVTPVAVTVPKLDTTTV